MKKIYLGMIVTAVLLLTGCGATSPLVSKAQDQDAKNFKPDKNFANVYIYRNEYLGGALSVNLHLNNKLIGSTGPETYFLLKLKPGKYVIQSNDNKDDSVKLDVKAKKNYYVWQEMKFGFMLHGTDLSVVNDVIGRKGVLECERLKSKL